MFASALLELSGVAAGKRSLICRSFNSIMIALALIPLTMPLTAIVCGAEESVSPVDASAGSLRVIVGDPDKSKDASEFSVDLSTGLKEHNFEALDSLADRIRSENLHYADGRMKLELFYKGLEADVSAGDEQHKAHLDNLRAWVAKKPESITARAAMVSALAGWAWKAGREHPADRISSAQFEVFSKRLKEANTALNEAEKLPNVCPHLYIAAEIIALGQHWPRASYDGLVDRATKKFPEYFDLYLREVYYLQPRWSGSQTEWLTYVNQKAAERGGSAGAKLFARSVWAVDNYNLYDNIFNEFKELNWQQVHAGFDALRTEYPSDLSLTSEFCKLAWLAGDTSVAKELIKSLDNRCVLSVWKTKALFVKVKTELL